MDILKLISDKDRLDFSQNFSINRNYMGDSLFTDTKTENFEAEYFRLTDGLQLPTMARIHALDTEAAIGTRPDIEKVTIEKLYIKEKINQSERLQLYINKGVSSESALLEYVFDDMGRMAENVKTRTEVAKMEAITRGKMTVKENNLNFTIDFGVPKSNQMSFTWSDAEYDILSDIQSMIDAARAKGKKVNKCITSTKIVSYMRKNKGIQTAMYGANGVGTFVSLGQLNTLMNDMFGFTIATNDEMYLCPKADGSTTTMRYVDEDRFVLYQAGANGSFGYGLWGTTPEEIASGAYSAKSADQYITISQWQTPDPVAVWTKASGLFVPVIPDPSALVIAIITL